MTDIPQATPPQNSAIGEVAESADVLAESDKVELEAGETVSVGETVDVTVVTDSEAVQVSSGDGGSRTVVVAVAASPLT